MVSTVAKATGHQIKGWRALTETFETPHRLKELGLTYILDWCADDQPFALTVPGMMSVRIPSMSTTSVSAPVGWDDVRATNAVPALSRAPRP